MKGKSRGTDRRTDKQFTYYITFSTQKSIQVSICSEKMVNIEVCKFSFYGQMHLSTFGEVGEILVRAGCHVAIFLLPESSVQQFAHPAFLGAVSCLTNVVKYSIQLSYCGIFNI